jgi:hypothetical protein
MACSLWFPFPFLGWLPRPGPAQDCPAHDCPAQDCPQPRCCCEHAAHMSTTYVCHTSITTLWRLQRGVSLTDVHGLLHSAGVVPTLLSAEQLAMLSATATGTPTRCVACTWGWSGLGEAVGSGWRVGSSRGWLSQGVKPPPPPPPPSRNRTRPRRSPPHPYTVLDPQVALPPSHVRTRESALRPYSWCVCVCAPLLCLLCVETLPPLPRQPRELPSVHAAHAADTVPVPRSAACSGPRD